jgi:hypothetical protein
MTPGTGPRVITLGLALAAPLAAQVQTEVPPVVPGAKPVTVERVKIHGAALEGNLEGNAVDRDAIVFLPPTSRHPSRATSWPGWTPTTGRSPTAGAVGWSATRWAATAPPASG